MSHASLWLSGGTPSERRVLNSHAQLTARSQCLRRGKWSLVEAELVNRIEEQRCQIHCMAGFGVTESPLRPFA